MSQRPGADHRILRGPVGLRCRVQEPPPAARGQLTAGDAGTGAPRTYRRVADEKDLIFVSHRTESALSPILATPGEYHSSKMKLPCPARCGLMHTLRRCCSDSEPGYSRG